MKKRKKVIYIILILVLLFLGGCNTETTYTVQFVDYNSKLIKEVEVTRNQNVVPPSIPLREGYTFTGWNNNLEIIESDLIVQAQYEPNTYKIFFDDYFDPINVKYDSMVKSLPIPTRDGYIFVGWKLNGEDFNVPLKYQHVEDIHLTPEFVEDWDGKIYLEVYSFLEEVDTWLNDANDFREDFEYKINFSHNDAMVSSTILATSIYNRNLNYCDSYYNINGIEEHLVVREKDDSIYFEQIYNREGMPDLVESQYLGTAAEFPITFPGDFSKEVTPEMKYRKIDTNHYRVEILFGDVAINTDVLKEYFESLGMNYNEFKKFKVIVEFIFDPVSGELEIIEELNEDIHVDGVLVNINLSINIKYNRINNTPLIDLDGPNYEKILPNEMDNALFLPDISQSIITSQSPNPHFYQAYFEAGQYVITSPNDSSNHFNIQLYGLDKNPANIEHLYPSMYLRINQPFIIEEGTYYIEIDDYIYDDKGYNLKFLKLDYQTIYDKNNPLSLSKEVSGMLEGEYDCDIYNLSSNSDGILVLYDIEPNVTVSGLNLQLYDMVSYTMYNDNILIPILNGDNYIYITSSESQNYSFKTDIIYDNYSTTNIENMNIITSEFTDLNIVTGNNCEPDYYRFEVKVAGRYVVEYDKLYPGSDKPTASFYKSHYLLGNNIVNLNEGIYYIKFDSSSLAVVKAKCRLIVDTVQVKPFELKDYDGTNFSNGTSPMPSIEDIVYTNKSIIYHDFTINETSKICINSSKPYQLLDKNLIDLYDNPFDSNTLFYTLSPGSYRIRILNPNIEQPYTFRIARLTNDFEDDYYESAIPSIQIEKEIDIVKNYIGDVDIFKFEVLESKNYSINSLDIRIYDSNMSMIENFGEINYSKTFNKYLTEGTYYIVSLSHSDRDNVAGRLYIR